MSASKASVSTSTEHVADAARILIVDDNYRNRRVLEAMLMPAGFRVTTAPDGEAALALVMRERPDLILLDVMMPGMDGYEIARRLKTNPATKHIPIIMITALDDREACLRGLQMGVEDFVSKPVDRAELCMRVRNLARLRTNDDDRYGDALSGAVRSRTVDLLERTEALEHEAMVLSERAILLEQMRIEQLRFKDEFLSHVSHELRSPLTAIKQFTSIMLAGLAGPLSEQQREYQLVVWRNIGQLQSMIDDLLEVTRLETGKLHMVPASVSMPSTVRDAIDTVRESARARDITLHVAISDHLFPALADPTRLQQILIILLDNALKFTPKGGDVTVSVRPSPDQRYMLECDVSDTGCGISAERAGHVFERLYQGEGVESGSRRGLGLGLYICQELVQAQGGQISVRDRAPLQGTTFTFTIPQFALDEIVAPLASVGKWPAASVMLLVVEATTTGTDISGEAMREWSRSARALLTRCMLPDLDILLPDLDGFGDASRFFVTVFADASGARTLADRIRRQFEGHPELARSGAAVTVSEHSLAPLPPYDVNATATMISRLASTVHAGIAAYNAQASLRQGAPL